jgi:hypothetical protein
MGVLYSVGRIISEGLSIMNLINKIQRPMQTTKHGIKISHSKPRISLLKY